MTTRLEQAKELLSAQYHENYEIVQSSSYHRAYVNEKLRHSLQVAGAGNYILRHEDYFQNRSADFIDITKTAVLLHDIFRFSEVRRWFLTGEKSDHGPEGASFLKKIPVFNDIRITLPIKHHGHMIEEFYADPEYTEIADPNLKKDIEHIIFAVRDADKIANWHILTGEFEDMRLVWLPHPDDRSVQQGKISEAIWALFSQYKLPTRWDNMTNADEILGVLSWVFDINYPSSIQYSLALDLFRHFSELFDKLGTDSDRLRDIETTVKTYLQTRFSVSPDVIF